jgi:hypothetical protein
MWATAELCAREGAAAQAAKMLQLSLEVCPEEQHPRLRAADRRVVDHVYGALPPDELARWESRSAASASPRPDDAQHAEHPQGVALARHPSSGGRAPNSDGGSFLEVVRWRLLAAQMILSESTCGPPWPATLVELATGQGCCALTGIMQLVRPLVDTQRLRAPNKRVLLYEALSERYRSGRTKSVDEAAGTLEVKLDGPGGEVATVAFDEKVCRADSKGYTAMHAMLPVGTRGPPALLRHAAMCGGDGALELARRLLAMGVHERVADLHANTPLHFAAEKGDARICRPLPPPPAASRGHLRPPTPPPPAARWRGVLLSTSPPSAGCWSTTAPSPSTSTRTGSAATTSRSCSTTPRPAAP